jgi:hypothetical protein
MGLDFTHCDAHWSYSGFNAFRHRLCVKAGLGNLNDWQGFGGKKDWKKCKDSIKYFLHHSDCDGHLTPHKLKKIVPRLKELLDETGTSEEPPWDEEEYDRNAGMELIKGMKKAIAANQNLRFC